MSKCQSEGIEGKIPLLPSDANSFLPLPLLHFVGWMVSHSLPEVWAPCCREPCDVTFVVKRENSFFFFLPFTETNELIADYSHLNRVYVLEKRLLLIFFSFSITVYIFSKRHHPCAFRDYSYSFCFPILLVWFLNVISELELSSFNSNGIMPNPLRLAGKRFWAWCHLAFLRKGLLIKHRKKIRLFQTCKPLKLQGARSDRAFTNTPNILWHSLETAQEIPS